MAIIIQEEGIRIPEVKVDLENLMIQIQEVASLILEVVVDSDNLQDRIREVAAGLDNLQDQIREVKVDLDNHLHQIQEVVTRILETIMDFNNRLDQTLDVATSKIQEVVVNRLLIKEGTIILILEVETHHSINQTCKAQMIQVGCLGSRRHLYQNKLNIKIQEVQVGCSDSHLLIQEALIKEVLDLTIIRVKVQLGSLELKSKIQGVGILDSFTKTIQKVLWILMGKIFMLFYS